MSLLIKGMEMPSDRGEYELRLYVDSDGTATVEGAYCRFEGEPFEAVPVPPHGRLIDADALKKEHLSGDLDLFAQRWSFLKDVNSAPTIIPAEEV